MFNLLLRVPDLLLRFFPIHIIEKVFYVIGSKYFFFYFRRLNERKLVFARNYKMCNLLPEDTISKHILVTGCYEVEFSRFVTKASEEGGLLIDVGANMGYYSLLWCHGNESNKAIAFEASPRNIELISGNINCNFLQSRIELMPFAAGDKDGFACFDIGPSEQTGWGGLTKDEESNSTLLRVKVIRVDGIIKDPQIKLMKIDVEGAELLVLKGCEGLLADRRIDQIVFEKNIQRMNRLGIAFSDVENYLNRFGYVCRKFNENDDTLFVASYRGNK